MRATLAIPGAFLTTPRQLRELATAVKTYEGLLRDLFPRLDTPSARRAQHVSREVKEVLLHNPLSQVNSLVQVYVTTTN